VRGTYGEETEGYGPDELCDGNWAHHLDGRCSCVKNRVELCSSELDVN
jgi:hypothetical protein